MEKLILAVAVLVECYFFPQIVPFVIAFYAILLFGYAVSRAKIRRAKNYGKTFKPVISKYAMFKTDQN